MAQDGLRRDVVAFLEFIMFWTFLLAVGLASVFVKLGAASVTVSMLTVALQGAGIVVAVLVGLLLWKTFAR
jgi:hypothetical protein